MMMVACSSEDTALKNTPAAGPQMQFTATIAAPNSGATTRTEYTEVTTGEAAGTINVAWKVNDEIAAIVTNSEDKLVKTVLTVSKVNDDGSAVISGAITKPKNSEETVDLIYPADIVTVAADGSDYNISFDKMSDGTLDGTLESIADNIDYRRADDCELTVSGEQATLTSVAKLESKLSILKLTLQDKDGNALLASQVAIAGGKSVLASATLTSDGSSEVYLPVPAVSGANICIAATTSSNNYFYMKEDVTLAAKQYYQSTVKMTKGAHLALLLTNEYEAKDGEILTGTLTSNVKISIAAPVAPATTTTVTLKDVNINGSGTWTTDDYAGITCDGSTTIILEGENKVKGFGEGYPGIYVPENKTLIIQGTGSLDASSNSLGAGIGGGSYGTCGNITIKGGTVTATGGYNAAGIGGGQNVCGNIEISGGTVTATGGKYGAGIGSGERGSCGNITISGGTITGTGSMGGAGIGGGSNGTCENITISGGSLTATGGEQAAGIGGGTGTSASCGTITITSSVTSVTATKGSLAPRSIGAGAEGTCGTVTIGGTEYASGVTQNPYEYSAPPALSLTSPAVGQVIGSDGKNYAYNATLPTGVTKVAMIAYLNGSHGLAIALADESGNMLWSTAVSTAAAHTPAFTGGTWKLPSHEEWRYMFSATGRATIYSGLNGALANAGGDGSTLKKDRSYWSSSMNGEDRAYYVNLSSRGSRADWYTADVGNSTFLVRAVLEF